MIGIWSAWSTHFLWVVVITTSLFFALPIFLVPLKWARILGWTIPHDTDLAVYFGRCLGAFVLILELLMLRAALTGEAIIFAFQVLIAVGLFMAAVHSYGAVKRIQPVSETLEIGFYVPMTVLGLCFYPLPP